jgi:membrane protein required for colicin V production
MTPLDWAIIVALLLSIVMAAAQGFFFEVFSLVGAVAGYLLAAWQYAKVAAWFLPYVKEPWAADLAGFLTIFFAGVLLGGIAGRLTRWAMKEVGLGWFDQLLGASFGLVRGVIIATVLVMGLAVFAPRSQMLVDSLFGPYFLVLGRAAIWAAPAEVRGKFRDGIIAFREMTAEAERRRDSRGREPRPARD